MIAFIVAGLISVGMVPPSEHLEAAREAGAAYKLEPELLAAIAWHETRHNPTLVSKTNDCGPMQVRANADPKRPVSCKQLANVRTGYREGAHWLRWWLGQARGDLAAALRGYGCGYQRKRVGGVVVFARPLRPADSCSNFDRDVFAFRDSIRAATTVSPIAELCAGRCEDRMPIGVRR